MGFSLLWFAYLLNGVVATHFAYGTINWVTTTRNTAGNMQVKIFQNYAWRRNYAVSFWGYPQAINPTPSSCSQKADPYIGACPLTTIDLGANFQIYQRTPASNTYSSAVVDARISSFLVMQESTDYLLISRDSNVNWIRGFFIYDWVVPDDTAEYIVVFTSAARLSTILDGNGDQSWMMTCNIKILDTFYRSRGPSTTGSIREYLESCVESAFNVPRVLSDNLPVSIYTSVTGCESPYRISSQGVFLPKSCLLTPLPRLICDSSSAVSLTTAGKLTWYPKLPQQSSCASATTLQTCQDKYNSRIGCFWDSVRNFCEKKDEFALQFTVLENPPYSLYTTYDVIFEVSRFCPQSDTTCNHAPHFSPRFVGPYYGTPNTPFDATYHKSVCGNINGTSCPILRGVEKSLPINAVDYDKERVTASYSLLPFGMSISPPTIFGTQIADPYDSNILKSWTTYTLKWIPQLDAIDAVVCFQALDSQGKPSNGNYCLNIVILEAEYIYVSGIVRDFMTNHTDFARPEYTADDSSSGTAQWIQSGLSNGKPVRNNVALTSVSKFGEWFNTIPGVNMQTVFSTTLVRLGTEDRFTYSNTNFLPINGILFGNDNTQGSAFSTRAYNSFFTYEMHTYLAYNASTNVNYTYGSTDDMWLFINGVLVPGWNLHGIHPPKYQTIDLKALYAQGNPLQFVNDTTLYRVDVFYADRSRNRTEPMIQMQLPKAVLCDALSSGVLEMQFVFNGTYSVLSNTNLSVVGAVAQSPQGLILLTQSQTASAVYMADNSAPPVPKPLKVLQGFQATFDFRINGAAQGFAFVISSQNSVGNAGDQLGYGGIQNVLVVEFDTSSDPANGDPAYDHVAVMAPAYNSSAGFSNLAFTSNHKYTLGSSIYNPSYPEFGPQLTLTNGSSHRARITYAPPQQGDTSEFKTGWLRVWIGAVIKPVVEVPIPAVFLGKMLGSAAYVGFTSGAGTEATSKILIQNLQIIVVPPSPTNTGVLNWVTTIVAGIVNSVTIQSRDSCGNNILVGADQARFGAKIAVSSSQRVLSAEVTTSFTTNNDGTYNFVYSCTRAGQYKVTLTFDGVEIIGSGATLIVIPAATSRTRTKFVFGTLPVLPSNSLAGGPSPAYYMIAVQPSDGTILGRVQDNNPTSIFAWLNSFPARTIFGIVNIGPLSGIPSTLSARFNALGCSFFATLGAASVSSACVSNGTAAQAYRISEPVEQVSRNFGNFAVVAQSDVTQSLGYLNVVQTASTSLIFFASTNSTLTTVTVIAMDQYGNQAQGQDDQFSLLFSPVMTNGNTNLIPVSRAPGYYSATLSTASASLYTMSIVLVSAAGGGNIDSIPEALTFLAGPASYLTSTANGIGLSNSQAGIPAQFSLQLIDIFGNQIRDTFNALKNSVVVYFVNSNGVVVNCSQTWSPAASELIVSYTPYVLGTYNLSVVINGNSSVFVAGRQMLVVPGVVSAPACTYSDVEENAARSTSDLSVEVSSAAAGVQKCIWVQSRDQFGNARNSPSDIFTFKLIGGVRSVINSSYTGGGIYVHCFIPTVAPNQITVSITTNNTLIGNPPLSKVIDVSVGAPSALSFLPSGTLQVTAGVPKPLPVACYDSENNTISSCNPANFSFTLLTSNGIPSTLNASAGSTGFVSISAVANLVGSYTIQVRANSQQIRNSPFTMLVSPAVTDTSFNGQSTPPQGAGAFGGVQNTATTFQIQAEDRFGNNQNHFNDVIIAKINNGANIVAQPSTQPGLWTVNYTVPLTAVFYISYMINGVLSYNSSAIAALNSAVCTLRWNSSAYYVVKAGAVFSLSIPYTANDEIVTGDSTLFQTDSGINSTIFQVILTNNTLAPAVEFTTAVNASARFPYQGTYSGLQTVGTYAIMAYANRFVPCSPNSFVTVIPGEIDTGATQFVNVSTEGVAGRNYSFQVILRDKFGQTISDPQNVLALTLSDILGQNPINFASSYNPATSAYNFVYQARVAGSYSAFVNLTSPYVLNKLGQSPYISILPGEPFAANSVGNLPSVQAAGSQVSFFVSLYDNAGNSTQTSNMAVNFDSTKWNLDVLVGGQRPSNLVVTPSLIDGRFYVSYIPTVASDSVLVTLTLLNNNVTAGVIPTSPVRIDAGAVAVPPSSVMQGDVTVAGNAASIVFSAYDANNNTVLGAALSSYATSADGIKFPLVSETGNGKYTITLSEFDTRHVGNYTWAIQVNSQVVNVDLKPLVVVPGPVDWSQLVIPSLTGLAVGAGASTVLQLKDQYGNNVTNSSVAGITAMLQQPGVFCASLSGENPINLTDVSSSSFANITVTGLKDGQVGVAFTPTTRGLFRLSLLLNGIAAPCQDSAVFGVSAGLVNAPKSKLTITSNTTADSTSIKTARIVFLDAYGNNVDDFSCRFLNSIYFGNHSYGNPVVSPAANWLKPKFSVNCQIENQFFVYYVTFEAPVAGSYSSVLVLGEAGSFDIISGPKPLVVLPGSAASFSIVAGVNTPRATHMAQFTLPAKDVQGNVIIDTSSHYFEVICRLLGANGAVLYSFQPNVTAEMSAQRATFFSTWAGAFQCEAKLYQTSGVFVTSLAFPLQIDPAVCPLFQCPNGICVSDYSACAYAVNCPATASVQCADGSCKASSLDCGCPAGSVQCSQGYCAKSLSQCPPVVGTCSSTDRCRTGECPTASSPCPSLTVCPPGFIICSDTLTCVLNATLCPMPVTCSGANKYSCAQGNCVAAAPDCPARATCPSGTVLCFDGTCASSSNQCPSIYDCPASASFRCSDASCVPTQNDCPSQTSCPTGFVKCWNDVCATSLGACDPITRCPSGTLRCSTGDCAVNIYMCPSQQSCPSSASIMCPDGACVTSVTQCSLTFACPSGFLTCPSGSCIKSINVSCPTQTSCPVATPVLCTDGSCAASATACTTPPQCPVASPVRCPDGSCRGSVLNCPTMVVCPAERPISCQDGYCASDISQCVAASQLSCPAPLVRCFYGECVSYLNACPPHTTCPIGYDRCSDGTCRLTCDAVISVGKCAPGKIQCPQANIGTVCADTLAMCPPGIVCPVSTPTRCFDGSCADSLANCVTGSATSSTPIYNSGSAIPCPDGTWSPDGLCGTPIFCPLGQFLCSNYQCLTVQTDCPVSATCASSSGSSLKPLLCGTVCVSDFSANECTRTSSACSALTPFRCPDGVCRSNPNLCVASAVSAASRCAPLDLCRDGTCSGTCPSASVVCAKMSPSTPVACPDGMCTDNVNRCNKENGCPYNTPYRCSNTGLCTDDRNKCVEIVCPAGGWTAFGFCLSSEQQFQIRSNLCPLSFPKRCFDGTCVIDLSECVSPTWDTAADVTPPNTCPFSSPFHCANGYCATASNMCPTIPSDYCDGNSTGKTACADGSCVTSSIFCPIVRPCLVTEVRQVDGVCRSLDFFSSFGSLLISTCRASYPYRCANGLCAKDSSSCLDPTSMCSAQQPTRCPNGACISGDPSSCAGLLGESNGCDNSAPIKCWNGECVSNASSCSSTDMCPGQPTHSRCPLSKKCVADISTGCADDANVTCPTSSFSCGSCETSLSNCVTTEGCPLATPVRCASGICSTIDNCPPTVVCDRGQVVCADGSCQFTLLACPPFPACAAGTSLCSDKTCKANCTQSVCPASSPILCRNGACTSNLKLCPGVISIELNPGVANGNDTYVPACPSADAPARCFDGRCRSFQGCLDFARQVNTTLGGNAALLNCASPSTICHDGSCATDLPWPTRVGVYCPIIPRCPSETYRCGDGSCRKTCGAVSACAAGTLRCEDGRCRTTCLTYDGCGLRTPYHCANRNCAAGPEGCVGQPSTLGVSAVISVGRRLLQSNVSAPTPAPAVATWCKTNCISQIKAYQMTVTVDPSVSSEVDLAVDATNNVVASMFIPSGALLSTSENAATIEFRPVGDSLTRNAENAVHPTRQTEFGAQMTYAETLLSVAFECVVPSNVLSPFALNLTYSATIDFTRRPSTQYLSTQNSGPDVCLAYLYRIPALRYSRWTCFPDGVTTRHNFPPNDMPAGVQLDRVEGPVSDCGKGPLGKIYGFIHSPLKSTNVEVASAQKTWAENNVLLVLMIFLLAFIVLILCIYCGFRLQRYRKKYLKEAEAVDKMKDEVEEMEQYGGTAGTKDEEVEMIPNVMVVQLQQLQDTMNIQNKEEKERELENLRQETEDRRKHLESLRADRDNLAAELSLLQSDFNKKQSAPIRPVIEDLAPPDKVSVAPASPEITYRNIIPTTKMAFASIKPNKKKNL